MDLFVIVLQVLYVVLTTPLILYAAATTYLIYLFLLHRGKRPQAPVIADAALPKVTIQLPLYNESSVAARLVRSVAALDYPRDRLHIQVLDDSTDGTTEVLQQMLALFAGQGLRIDLIHRTDRTGYKAGALANGLSQTDGEIIAIFDADFLPPRDFLRKTVPYFFLDDRVGVVQTRWGHLNDDDNLLTRTEALMIDGHFAIEQFARSAGDLIFLFNGTCGLWRRSTIIDAGGWHDDTLGEDTDLSFRAQMKGWRFIFVPDVIVPGEVPPNLLAFRVQQARWSKGTTQVLIKLGWKILRSPLTLRQRIMGLIQLMPYFSQMLALVILLLMPILMVTQGLNGLPLGPLGLFGASVPILYVLSQQALYRNWVARSLMFPVLMICSSGLTINNTLAVIEAILGKRKVFQRTPKFNRMGGSSGEFEVEDNKPVIDATTLIELAVGTYVLFGALLATSLSVALVPYFVMYVVGFYSVAIWSIAERIALRRPPERIIGTEAAEA